MNEDLHKNILDLNYNKHLQYLTTAIIILFTYIIGLAIGVLTNKIEWKLYLHVIPLVILTSSPRSPYPES